MMDRSICLWEASRARKFVFGSEKKVFKLEKLMVYFAETSRYFSRIIC